MTPRYALVELSDALRDLQDPAEIAYAASDLLGRTLGVSRVGYAGIDHDAETLHVERDWTAPGVETLAGVLPLRAYGSFIDSLKLGEFTVIGDVRDDVRTASAAEALEGKSTRSFVNAPVVEHGRLVAVFFVNAPERRTWSDEDLSLIREFADRTRTAVERARAEVALRESEERYRTLFERIDEGFCIIEFIDGPQGALSDYVHIQANSAYAVNAGIPDIVGKRLREIVSEQEANGWAEIYRNVLTTGTSVRFERGLEATGRQLELAAFRVEPANKRQVAVLFKDVTARKLAEERLRELNETLESQVAARSAERDQLWNLSQDMLARADFSGMMSAVSPAWTQVLGWRQDDLLTRPYATFMHPDDLSPTLNAIARMAESQEPTRIENRIATHDGGWKHIEWTVAPEGDGINFIAVGRDLSVTKAREAELEIAQEALRQSQKMEAMGSLTGGVAHDFNNLLTPIIGSLDMLVRKSIGSERERRLIDGALQSAERAKTLVQRLLAFARRQPLQPVAVDLQRLVDGMVELIGSTLGPTIDLRVDVHPDLPLAKADPNQLEMALLNLAVNARDAMPNGGELVITAAPETVRSKLPSGIGPGDYVRLGVKDTGSGMDEGTRLRAVEPFFSTKGVGKGTGLGLSMVHGLAAQLGGGLIIESAVGQGTMVELWLPVSADPIGSESTEGSFSSRPIGRGIALLVDDEELVRMSTADMLIDLGFEVTESGSAEDALDLIQSGKRPDLLVTDHLMPGMNGVDLAQAARAIIPELPVLIVSGYAEAEGLAPELPRLTKPFRNAELAASLSVLIPEAHARSMTETQ
ncbi:MAG TPA: PAS domain S-box protein [Sphingomicrobium sp.]|nr:PAS domain S-box protein [Sphingomicrobium sp.]